MRNLNVLFFSPDTVRRDHVSCYGYERRTTPNLDRLAKEGVLFTDHVANSGWTLPQYVTMHTGMYPLTHRMTLLKQPSPLSPKIITLAEILKAHGYATQAFTSSNLYLHPQLGYVTYTYTDVLSGDIGNIKDPTIYRSQRFGQEFSYIFDVPNGKYIVKLHFAETLMDAGGIEFFDVYIQNKPALTSYNIFNDAGGRNKAIVKTFICEVSDNRLIIRFVGLTEPQQEAAKVSAIEVLPYNENVH